MANGEIVHVKSSGTIEISPNIKLPNCLYILALSHKLLLDIRTGLLIGHGTEKGGLYYVDEVSQQGEQNSQTHDTPPDNNLTSAKTTERYVLPQRVNRGIPPKRYYPEKEDQRSRYPIANIAQGNLFSKAQKFNSALYSEEVPTTIDQAMKSGKWRKAMEEEIEALKKNDTWDKCVIP
ncbi:uncharacterized protein [Rutidosis leptorrhynchoides]|uniref:uncharacterized protein n=1 Tax=Rutidosis leptorrhynchoides TaxID=125765 RepID=UPI003A99E1ED